MTKYSKNNVLVGDNVLILKTASGEKIACPRHAASLDPLKPGDKVVITPRANGIKDCCLVSSLDVGDKVAINQLQNGEKIALKLTEKFNQTIIVSCNHTYGNYGQIVPGAPVDLGTYTFKWDGEAPVYFRGTYGWNFSGVTIVDGSGLNVISIRITTDQGTLVTPVNGSGTWPSYYPTANDIELSSIMKRGENRVQVQFEATENATYSVLGYMCITVQNQGENMSAD